MTIFEIDPLQDPRWKVLIERHPGASIFHRVEWLRALQSCYGYVPRALSFSPPGSPLQSGLVFCEVRSLLTGNRFVSLPFSDHCEVLVSEPEQLAGFLTDMAERVDQGRWNYFEIRPILSKPLDSQKHLGISNTYYFHRIDLHSSEEIIFKSLHKDCVQRKIRRAEREKLRYEAGTSDTLLKHFYKLMIMTRRRQKVPPQPLKWFQSLIASLGGDLQIRIAFQGDTPVASILTICGKKTMVYKYGCSDVRFNNLGATAMLFWKAIQEAKAKGIVEFDMGRSDLDNSGLVTFKEHWGSQRSVLSYLRYPAPAASSGAERAIKHFQKVISVTPDTPLVMLGRLFYRHIG
jgi:CelD/BcsL family acetyltransferase involved in cellulose biosynthesis